MQSASQRHNETRCLRVIHGLAVLDSAREPVFDAPVAVAAATCGAPIALFSLVDADRLWFKASVGLQGIEQTPRDIAFCAHAILGRGVFEVADARLDPRFADNPLVVGPPGIRHYAGAPVYLSDDTCVGTVCVLGHEPRQLEAAQTRALAHLATAAGCALEGRHAIRLTLPEQRDGTCGPPGAGASLWGRESVVARLDQQDQTLRATLGAIGDGVITTDAQDRVYSLSARAEHLTGWTLAAARGLHLRQVFNVKADQGAARLVCQRGNEFVIESSATPIRDREGHLLCTVQVFRDVTEHQRLRGDFAHRTTHDALTGLANLTRFERRLEFAFRAAQDDGTEHALLYIDLDQLKIINDACGHSAGDAVLAQVARLLGEVVPVGDTLARLGGDEFAAIVSGTAEQACALAQRICDLTDAYRFMHKGHGWRIGTSIGLVPMDARWAAPAAIVQAADACCCLATEAGGNRVRAWSDGDHELDARHRQMLWATRLAHALDEDRLALFAQRILPLRGAAAGLQAEVLVRMIDCDGTLVPPGAFLPAAERFHLAGRLDRWVLKHAVDWLQRVPNPACIGKLSVNVSGQSVGDRGFHAWAMALLDSAGADLRGRLCLEITETAAITHMSDAVAFIRQVRAAGVRVALDDFGAGASSFGYLKSLPVDYLKIDGQFIRDLVTDRVDNAAVRCFVDVAKVIGAQTVAEFVDQPAVLARLREIGVDFAQGYLLHRPAPIDELIGSFPLVEARSADSQLVGPQA